MQIVLEKEDIERLINDRYQGVTEIKFNTKTVKATLDIDSSKFSTIKATKTFPIREDQMNAPENTPKPIDNEERAKKGAMAVGGVQRSIQHIG